MPLILLKMKSLGPMQTLVHGAGRVPEIDDLDLGTADVQSEKKGVKVNEYLQRVFLTQQYTQREMHRQVEVYR